VRDPISSSASSAIHTSESSPVHDASRMQTTPSPGEWPSSARNGQPKSPYASSSDSDKADEDSDEDFSPARKVKAKDTDQALPSTRSSYLTAPTPAQRPKPYVSPPLHSLTLPDPCPSPETDISSSSSLSVPLRAARNHQVDDKSRSAK